RILTSTISCPVLVSTAVSSTAHSSAPSRVRLVQRETQPGAGGCAGCSPGEGEACGVGAWAGAGAAGAAFFGACARAGGTQASAASATRTVALLIDVTGPAPEVCFPMCRAEIKVKLFGGFLDGCALALVLILVAVGATPAGERIGELVEIQIDDG